MLKILPAIILLSAQVGFGYAVYHWGYTKAEKKIVENENAALIEFAKNQNTIYNSYTPQMEALSAELDKTFASPLVSSAINSLPKPKSKPRL